MGTEICIAVNVSVPQFKVKGYAQNVKNTLLKYGVKPKNIELEVTESVVMDELETVINTLRELQELGIEIAIDDFGTGFSSLSYIQSLPLDRLKIDRAFIMNIENDKDDVSMVKAIIAMSKSLNLIVLAEGIENSNQLNLLQNLSCDRYQGYYFNKPLDSHTFTSLYFEQEKYAK